MVPANSKLKCSVVIRPTVVRGNRVLGAKYKIIKSMTCPLGKNVCRYNGGESTLCYCANADGVKKICVCGASRRMTENGLSDFSPMIENFVPHSLINKIISEMRQH